MNKEQARDLLKFVNDPWVLEDLKKYMEVRIAYLHKKMELADTVEEVRQIQGAIKELRRIEHLRDEVRQLAEGK